LVIIAGHILGMTRRKRRKATLRTKKFKKKFLPREVNLIFKENVGFYSINLRDYLRLDNILENETLKLLDENVERGIIKEDEKDLYLAFWRKVRELGQDFTGKTLLERVEEVRNEFISRGLKEEKLNELIDLALEQVARKKLFEKWREYSLLIDYLKLKAFATMEPRFIKPFQIKPIYQFALLLPLEFIKMFKVKPIKQINLLLPKPPIMEKQFTYKNFLRMQLILSVHT